MQQDKTVVLALDSSSAPLLLALKAGGKTYTARHGGIKQEEYLFTIIRRLYAKAGIKFNSTTHFFFVKGPGRFTGIRIGITLASMLNSLLNTRAAGADIFEILKYQAENSKEYKNWLKENPTGIIAVVVHAFREEYFACVYYGDNKPVWLSLEALQELLAKQQKPLFITGWDKERQLLSGVLPKQYTYASAKISKVMPQTMLDFAQSARDDKDVLEPLYLKPARFELVQK